MQSERDILEQGFASVKTEFTDLDGLKWEVSEVRNLDGLCIFSSD